MIPVSRRGLADPQLLAAEHEAADPESDLGREAEEGRNGGVADHDFVLSRWQAAARAEQVGFQLPELAGCDHF